MDNQIDYLKDINILKNIIEEKYNKNNIFSFKETYNLYNSINNIENFFKYKLNLNEKSNNLDKNKSINNNVDINNDNNVDINNDNNVDINNTNNVDDYSNNNVNDNNVDDYNNINNNVDNYSNNNVNDNTDLNNLVNINIIEKEIKNILLENITNYKIEELSYNNLNI